MTIVWVRNGDVIECGQVSIKRSRPAIDPLRAEVSIKGCRNIKGSKDAAASKAAGSHYKYKAVPQISGGTRFYAFCKGQLR